MAGAGSATPSISVDEATAQLDQLLGAADEITTETAQAVTTFVSSLLDVALAGGTGGAPLAMGSQAAQQLQSSVAALASAAPPPGEGQLTLLSTNMNVSAEAFADTASLAAKPLRCPSSTGQEASVALPPGLMTMGDTSGFDPSLPVSTLLYIMSTPLHAMDNIEVVASGLQRRRSMRLLSAQNASSQNASIRLAGPMVSFSLLQSGSELRIKDASSPINISVPLQTPSTSTSRLACRWWDASGGGGNGSWSSSGCTTVASPPISSNPGNGGVTCSCTHLSDCECSPLETAKCRPHANASSPNPALCDPSWPQSSCLSFLRRETN